MGYPTVGYRKGGIQLVSPLTTISYRRATSDVSIERFLERGIRVSMRLMVSKS
jgi:hypothetical protein